MTSNYDYDLRGLMTKARFDGLGGEGVTNIYDGVGRVTWTNSDMGGINRTLTYQYDRDGVRTRLTHPDGVHFTFGSDGLDRLTSASWTKAGVTSPLYQTSGSGGANLTWFLYDGDQLALEYDSVGAIKWRYAFGPGIDEPLLADEGGLLDCNNTRFLHLNHQGSMVAAADCSGKSHDHWNPGTPGKSVDW